MCLCVYVIVCLSACVSVCVGGKEVRLASSSRTLGGHYEVHHGSPGVQNSGLPDCGTKSRGNKVISKLDLLMV